MTNQIESPHEAGITAAANELRPLPGWSHAFRLEHEAKECAESAIVAYLRTLVADPRVKEEMARAMRDHRGELVGTRDEACRELATACIDALARMVGVA